MRRLPLLLPIAAGCATMSGARPLARGQTALGATVGGGMVDLGAPVPLPNVLVEARHGLPELAHRPFDLGCGLNVTGLPFGLVAGYLGADWLLVPQARARPALSLTDRVFFATNVLGLGSRIDPELELWGADQVELTASWLVRGHLPYVSLSQYIDFGSPALTLTPAVGAVFDPARAGRGVTIQAEVRWYGVSMADRASTVTWIPGSRGILGVSVGLSAPLAHREEK